MYSAAAGRSAGSLRAGRERSGSARASECCGPASGGGEIGRAPASRRVSVHIWGEAADVRPGAERRQRLRDYASLGLSRAIVQGFAAVSDEHAVDDVVDDCRAVGLLDEVSAPA